MILRRLLSVLAVVVFLTPLAAKADTINATSQVTAATVFSDRALVTRAVKVHVPAGAQIITITDMPAGFDESSIRVQGKSVAAVKIGTVEVKHIYLAEQANTAEREKTAAIEAKNDEKAFLQGEIASLKVREDFIERLVSGGADDHDKDLSKLDFSPDKWVMALKTLQAAESDTQKDLVTKNIAMRKLDEEINVLAAERNQISSTQARERRDVYINIEAAQDADVDLSVTYQTGGALWRPVYDARLDTTTGALDMEQYGQVSQQTGEDWKDIDLTLSTAQPAAGSEMPRMQEWWVRLFQPIVMLKEMRAVGGAAGNRNAALAQFQSAMPAAAPAMDEKKDTNELREAEVQQAAVQTTEYAANFHVPGHASLKSVRDASKMFIGAVHMKAGLASQVSPRLTPQAYLFAKITNGESYPLVSGMVAKYRDGTFIGNAPLSMLRPGETANLSFGVDDRVKVTYQRTREEQDNPALIVVGDRKTEREYQTKIQNLHKDPITITVFEQYPVSGDPDVKSELLEDVTTPGYAKDPDNRQGVITWSAAYDPKEEKTFVIGFRVKYPKDKQITGL